MSAVEEKGMGLTVSLAVPYDKAVEEVKAALKRNGFGVLTEIDVRDTLKQKIGVEFSDYVILGACNPHIAHRALQANAEVGLMLPCTVLVYDNAGKTTVSALNPDKALNVLGAPELQPFASEASAGIRAAMAEIAAMGG